MPKDFTTLKRTSSYAKEWLNESDLMFQIHKKTMEFGVMPSELEQWIVDSPPVDDDEDHWMNVRDY